MSNEDRYSPRAKVKAGMVMYTKMDIAISPLYFPVFTLEKGTKVTVLEVYHGESTALVRLFNEDNVTGVIADMHLTTNPNQSQSTEGKYYVKVK